jgi:N-methylhydantoinase A
VASNQQQYVIGVDIGGTFTDCIVVDGDGRVTIGKSNSTPGEFERGFVDSLGAAAERMEIEVADLIANAAGIYHGCTVGTNALVENRTAKVGLLTTRGHADSLHSLKAGGRYWGFPPEEVAHVAAHYKQEPLVPHELIAEVDERVTFDGEVLVALNEDSARAAIEGLLEQGVEAFAISYLWSVVNSDHEQATVDLVREIAPDAFVSAGSAIVSRTGEYERTVATVVNSLIGPPMSSYLKELERELDELGYRHMLYVMSCSGGVIGADYARARPLLTIGSGPVAGLVGAGALTRLTSAERTDGAAPELDVITADMGGTTFDVGVIRRGSPLIRDSTRHGQYEYFVPTLDVRSVGAGGGSIIRFDPERETLRVGPRSAGARPGPASYGRGGTDATVADADLILGYLNPDFFLGGRIKLDVAAAEAALGRAGEPLGFSAEETAAAAIRIVDSQMADAIRVASVQQGYDPRDHAMYAYGGGGPVHATSLAKELGITKIVVPLSDLAAGWSAFGVVSSDAVVVEERPATLANPFDPAALNADWELLENRVREIMEPQRFEWDSVQLERSVDIRYATQVHEVRVDAPDGIYDAVSGQQLLDLFEEEYARLFGPDSGYPDAGYILTNVRITARAPLTGTRLGRGAELSGASGAPPQKGSRGVIYYELGPERVETAIYDGERFEPGMSVSAPAIIEFVDTTLILRQGQRASVDAHGSVVVDV